MQKASYLQSVALAAACSLAPVASATVLFQDNFENQVIGTDLAAPQIGQSWIDSSSGPIPAGGLQVVGSPALGTKSLMVQRESTHNGDARGISLPGVIQDGNVVEVLWSHNLEHVHRFNNPMQVALGHVGSNFNNDALFIAVGDANGGNYGYYTGPAQFGNLVNTTVQPTLNTPGANEGRWDTLRAVMTFSQLNPTQMSGTFDLFVSLNGAAEVQIADDALLQTTSTTGLDPTSMQFRIVKGPSSGIDFYDDISVRVVPEPSLAALGAAAFGLLGMRRSRR